MSKSGRSETAIELAVGAFVAIVFTGLAVFTIAISGKSLFRKDVFQLETVLPDAMGLRRNDPVIAKGTTVGAVSDVFYDKDGVHVKAKLEAPVEFHEGYEITVVATSILGGRQLMLREGDPSAPVVPEGTVLKGLRPSDLMEDAAAAVAKVREFLDTDALDNLRAFSENLKNIGARLDAGEGTLGRLLSSDDTIYRNLDEAVADAKAAIADLKSIAARLEAGEGTLGRLLSSDDTVYRDISEAVANVKSISARLEAGEGTLGRLLSSDDELYRNVNGTVADARELLDDMREANTLSTFTSLLFSGF